MKNNKLISLLHTFSPTEIYHFRKYLDSPFFNENDDLLRLFDVLKKTDFLKSQTEKEEGKLGIWATLFPQKKYDDTRYRRLFSDLLQMAFDFLAYQQYQQNPAASRVMLLRSLSATRLEKHFAGVVRQTKRELEKNNFLDADFHYLSYMLQRRQHEQSEHIAQKSTAFDFLEKADHHLDCYYFSKKLEHYSDTLGYQGMTTNTADIRLLPGIFEYLKISPYLKEQAVKAWYLTVQMLQNQEEESYFLQLKKLLEEKGQYFPKKDRKTLFIHLMNYCIISKIHNNHPEYNAELLSLYKTALTQKIIFENNELPLTHYKNIVAISLHLKDFEWVEKFIQEYTSFLPLDDRENAVFYNLAKVYFHQKKHEAVIEQLRAVEYNNVEYAIGSRLMLLQTYFELYEINALDSLLDSFKIYLRRSKSITKATQQRCLNIIRFTKKLSNLAPYDEKGKAKLHAQILACKNVGIRPWLLEKCSIS